MSLSDAWEVITDLRASDLRNRQFGSSKGKSEDNIKVFIVKVKIEKVMSRFSWLKIFSSGFFEKLYCRFIKDAEFLV